MAEQEYLNSLQDDYETLILSINNLKFWNVSQDQIQGIIENVDLVIERLNKGERL